ASHPITLTRKKLPDCFAPGSWASSLVLPRPSNRRHEIPTDQGFRFFGRTKATELASGPSPDLGRPADGHVPAQRRPDSLASHGQRNVIRVPLAAAFACDVAFAPQFHDTSRFLTAASMEHMSPTTNEHSLTSLQMDKSGLHVFLA